MATLGRCRLQSYAALPASVQGRGGRLCARSAVWLWRSTRSLYNSYDSMSPSGDGSRLPVNAERAYSGDERAWDVLTIARHDRSGPARPVENHTDSEQEAEW
jgi:hypothetical protein